VRDLGAAFSEFRTHTNPPPGPAMGCKKGGRGWVKGVGEREEEKMQEMAKEKEEDDRERRMRYIERARRR
jgi:hypothetical protein